MYRIDSPKIQACDQMWGNTRLKVGLLAKVGGCSVVLFTRRFGNKEREEFNTGKIIPWN